MKLLVRLSSAAIGLGASIVSALDYFAEAPMVCGDSGCATVRASSLSHPLGIPTPVLGIAFFAGAAALFFSRQRVETSAAWAKASIAYAALGGAVGGTFLLAQAFILHSWCKVCVVVDTAALVHAFSVIMGAPAAAPTRRSLMTYAAAAASTVGGLALFAKLTAPPPEPRDLAVPEMVLQEQQRTHELSPSSGAAAAVEPVTVVEFVDFECPFCREMQARLSTAMRSTTRPVRVVRKMMPLAKHAGALPAALAWCCADEQGRGDEMAEALFNADPDELTSDGCLALAARIGLDLERYSRVLDDPSTQARIADDMNEAHAAGVRSLPTVFIGQDRIVGASRSADELVALLDGTALEPLDATSSSTM